MNGKRQGRRTELNITALLGAVLPGRSRERTRLARSLVEKHGGLRAILDSAQHGGCTGISARQAEALAALPEIARRYFSETLPAGRRIRSPADTEEFLHATIGHLGHELFCCVYLDNRHRVLHFDELFRGTIDGTSVYPREIVKEALAINAAAVIVAHNHPSGVAEPSEADERITRRIRAALELVDIRLLDHLVIGRGSATSFASRGLL